MTKVTARIGTGAGPLAGVLALDILDLGPVQTKDRGQSIVRGHRRLLFADLWIALGTDHLGSSYLRQAKGQEKAFDRPVELIISDKKSPGLLSETVRRGHKT
jgi:hypothetical protein